MNNSDHRAIKLTVENDTISEITMKKSQKKVKIKCKNPEVRNEDATKLRENLNQFIMDEFKKINKENVKIAMS